MNNKIIHLDKEQWKEHILRIGYVTNEYYDVVIDKEDDGFNISIKKKQFDSPVSHQPEKYDFPDKLYADYYPDACAWGIVENGELIAAIETSPEKWCNRLRVTELWVDERYRRQGIAHELMNIAKEQARLARNRAIVLETQSCNVNAIGFYLHEGFTLIGFDSCSYNNNDLNRKEVRIELGWMRERKIKLSRSDIEIRCEREAEYHEVERMTQLAFWNKYHQGCDEHYLVHKLRNDKSYLPDISRIAVKDGEIIGAILYSKALVVEEKGDGSKINHEVLTFGPLCVRPDWQGTGVGELLFNETRILAERAGYKTIVIFGEPDYYPRVGFKTCDNYNITTPDGKNFDAFMGFEIIPGGFENISGKFYEAHVFEDLPAEEVTKFNKSFPEKEKMYFPTQWPNN